MAEATVETVRGPVPVTELGPTLMHEHVFVLAPELLQNFSHVWGGESYWDEEREVAAAIAKLRELRALGIRTIVDPTVVGLGRYVPRIQRVNAEVDLNILVATGVYSFFELPIFLRTRTDDALAAIFVRELTEGINDTGVRAAFLKCAVDLHGITGDVPRILGACARASNETGAPIMVHTSAKLKTGLPALEALLGLGVDARRIVIAHAGDSDDLDELRAIADTGASLGYDRFNMEFYGSDETRIRTLETLLGEGYGPQIHLAHDASSFFDSSVGNPIFADEVLDYTHISRTIIPRLLADGVTRQQVDELLIGNPRRFFS
jgi:phosphotriesterase-related protein